MAASDSSEWVDAAGAPASAPHEADRPRTEGQRTRLERLFLQAPAHINIFTGPDLVHTLVHPATARLFPNRPLLGRPRREAFPELPEAHHEAMERVYRTGAPYHAYERLTQLDRFGTGERQDLYFDITFQPLFDPAGQVEGVMSFAVDVTERVRDRQRADALQAQATAAARRQAQEREALYQVFAETPALVAILRGPEHRYEYYNAAYERHFAGRHLAGRTVAEALPEAVDQGFIALLDRVYQTGEIYFGQEEPIALSRVSGPPHVIYYTFTYQAYREHGEVAGVSIFAYDATAQVLARQEREAHAQQLRLITDALPVLISYLDHTETYRFANRAYEKWFPLTVAQIIGKHPRDVAGPAAYEQVRHHIARALAGERVEYEARMAYHEGLVRHVHTTLVPDVQQGQVRGFFSLVVDVTAQVEARQAVEQSAEQALALAGELAQANAQLTRVNVELDQFVYIASHDLHAPITNIEGLLRALREQLPAPEAAGPLVPRLLAMLDGAVQRFQLTLDQLAEIVHVQQAPPPSAGRTELAPVLADVALDLAPLVEATRGELVLDVAEGLALPLAPKNARSLVYNLLSNALKYRAPDRPPRVQVRAYEKAGGGVGFEVRDNGLGLDEAQQARLFGLFQRFHSHVEGTGMGLFMVKKITESADGRITVESLPGVGSVFTASFPG